MPSEAEQNTLDEYYGDHPRPEEHCNAPLPIPAPAPLPDDGKRRMCRHIFTDGHRCGSPSLRQEHFCYYHHATRRPAPHGGAIVRRYTRLDLPRVEDRASVQHALGEVLRHLADDRIETRRAGLLLYGLQIASHNLPKEINRPEPVEEVIQHPLEGALAPEAEVQTEPAPNQDFAPKSTVGSYPSSMYEDFTVTDRWTATPLHCTWKGTVVAIATRHADATDVRFAVNGRPVWIAMPNMAWIEMKKRTGFVITDYLAAQSAGRYLKTAIESGYDNGREMYTMTVDEVLEHANAVVKEAGRTDNLPSLPVINDDIKPETFLGQLPGDPGSAAYFNTPQPSINDRVKL